MDAAPGLPSSTEPSSAVESARPHEASPGNVRVEDQSREAVWAEWMRAALSGDAAAYRAFLEAVTPFLRGVARKRLGQYGVAAGEVEDVVQEALLAIHLKRGTWDPARSIGPWISVIVRNKLVDALRRRGRRVDVPIEDVIETLEADPQPDGLQGRDVDRILDHLKPTQRDIVRSISIDGSTVRETAVRLSMTEVAVRVALHRALKSLAALYRSGGHED